MERSILFFFELFTSPHRLKSLIQQQLWRVVINFLTEWHGITFLFGVVLKCLMPFLNGEHSVIFESCWIFIYPYFESGSRKDKNLSPPSLCILEFHCILWQPVLNIILHIFIPRKNLSRLWIIFLLTHFGGEFLRSCVQGSWVVDLWGQCLFS